MDFSYKDCTLHAQHLGHCGYHPLPAAREDALLVLITVETSCARRMSTFAGSRDAQKPHEDHQLSLSQSYHIYLVSTLVPLLSLPGRSKRYRTSKLSFEWLKEKQKDSKQKSQTAIDMVQELLRIPRRVNGLSPPRSQFS